MAAPTDGDDWRTIALATAATGGPALAPSSAATLDDLRLRFDLPPSLAGPLTTAYPSSPIRVGSLALFPALADLIELGREDAEWPRRWFPLDLSRGHIVIAVDSDPAAGERLLLVDLEAGGAPEPLPWDSLADLLADLPALIQETRADRWIERDGRRWLPDRVASSLRRRFGEAARADAIFDLVGLDTVASIRGDREAERSNARLATAIFGTLTLGAVALCSMGGGAWVVALPLGALPAAATGYAARAWVRARRRLAALAIE